MPADAFHDTLSTLLSELIDGASPSGGYVLNPGDPGLLASLDRLTSADASRSSSGGATIAAHVAHVTFGISLMNQWADGANPFDSADWQAAWRTTSVDDAEWAELRKGLRDELARWRPVVQQRRELDTTGHLGMAASVVHLAYHLGAIRQIAAGARGPKGASPPGN
jgi:hypothetical protein